MEILPLLNQPITQFGGVVVVAWALQKSGIDVVGLVRAVFGKTRSGVEEISADTRNALQPLLSEMEQLRLYANHNTTEGLDALQKGLGGLHDKLDLHVRQTDRMIYILEDIKDNGIKCRKE